MMLAKCNTAMDHNPRATCIGSISRILSRIRIPMAIGRYAAPDSAKQELMKQSGSNQINITRTGAGNQTIRSHINLLIIK